jgi:hypothetical protein
MCYSSEVLEIRSVQITNMERQLIYTRTYFFQYVQEFKETGASQFIAKYSH